MEDLFPLVIFAVIAGVNVLKFFAEKGKAKPTPGKNPPQAQRKPSALGAFFEDLAEQMAPKPTELADWPEGRERPDYVHEMEEFEAEQAPEPLPVEIPEPGVASVRKKEIPPVVQLRFTAPRRSGFRIEGRANLKQAMIAHIVFSPPRAFDLSFSDTIQKHG